MIFTGVRGQKGTTVMLEGFVIEGQFEWGFNGSGPTNLARVLLSEYFTATYTGDRGSEVFEDAHRDFVGRYAVRLREELISRITSKTWELSFNQLEGWISNANAFSVGSGALQPDGRHHPVAHPGGPEAAAR